MYGCEKLVKRYGGQTVLNELTLSFEEGGCYCLMAPSGGGKTTLFRILAGLEQADSGKLVGFEGAKLAMVFQENRLCEQLTPVTNVAMVQTAPDRKRIEAELSKILPPSCLCQTAATLSGGMKRRVAIARALLSDSDILLMDEPFTGLDEENREKVMDYVKEKKGDRLLLLTTHRPEEAEALGATVINL